MFELFFGLIWTAISIFMAFMFYGNSGGTITVNGIPTSQEDFNAMLGPKLFLGVFILVGVIMIVLGLRKIIRNIATSTHGREIYGLIVDVCPSGTTVNGRPQLQADVLIVEEDASIGRYSEAIGFDWNKYRHGDFVKLKHYRKDINILEKANEYSVPLYIKDVLEQEAKMSFSGHVTPYEVAPETITIDGVEYVKK